jgi:membrane fusion protein (multidrug efflux system)
MNGTKKTALLGVLTLAMILSSCGNMPLPGRKKTEEPVADKRYNVKTVIAMKQELSSFINLSGDVEASGTVDVYPSAAGKVASLPVKLGDYVRKDRVLATVDPSLPGMNYSASPVKAPISGTVTAINVDLGQTVSQQIPVVRIGELSKLLIKTQIPERFIYMVKKGQRAVITSSATENNFFDAIVTEISPIVNASTRTMAVTLVMDGDSSVKAGMFVSIKLITSTTPDALTIPEDALIVRNEDSFVYVVDGEQVVRTPVETGNKSSGLVEILSGLKEGDEIVTAGKTLLSDGSKIRIVNDLSFKSSMTTTGEDNS